MLTRRAALKGGTAVALSTAAITAAGGVAANDQTSPLPALIRTMKDVWETWMAVENALDEARARIGFRNVPFWGLLRVDTDKGPCDWGASEIERAATSDGCYGRRITIEQRDQSLADLEQQERRGRERYRELGLEPYLSEIERHRERYWALFHQICETPTKSVEGFAAKVSLLCEDLEESEPQLELVLSIRADAERLAGRAQS
jgi:hypothetical protein